MAELASGTVLSSQLKGVGGNSAKSGGKGLFNAFSAGLYPIGMIAKGIYEII